jgi:hypothetical protein
MRIVIASVLARSQFSDSLESVADKVRQLLEYPAVSAIYLLVARPHTKLFHEALACCDSRLEIISMAVGTSLLSSYRWHYKRLPDIASQLRADAVHLACPVLLKENAFYPGTVLSLDARHHRRPSAAPGMSKGIFRPWILTRCLDALSKVAWNSEVSLELVGMAATPSLEKPIRKFSIAITNRKAPTDQKPLAPQHKGAYSGM